MPRIDLSDDHVRHHIGVQRVASSSVKRTDQLFAQFKDRLSVIIKLNEQTIKFPSKSRVKGLLQSVRNVVHETYVELEKVMLEDLHEFTAYDAEFQQKLLSKKLNIDVKSLEPATIRRIAEKERIGKRRKTSRLSAFEGATIKTTLRAQEARSFRMLKKRIMQAVTANKQEKPND